MEDEKNIIEELKKQFLEFINNKDFENALVCINKLIELDDRDYTFYNDRGNLYADLGRNEEAEKDYNKAIELNPNDFNVYNNRGILYTKLGINEEAEKDYTEAIKLNPSDFNAYNNKFILKLNLLKSSYEEEKLKNIIDYLKKYRAYININIFEEFLFYIINLKENIGEIFKLKEIYLELTNNNLYKNILKLSNGNIKNDFFELYVRSEEILYLSKFNIEEEPKLAHYTSREAIINILRKKENKLRLKNSIYVNDPEEGEIFKEIIKFDYENKDKNSRIEYNKNNVYINCFSTNIDEDSSLPMWVNYGNQAKGCAIIFNNNFFGINKGNLEYINSSDDKILDKSTKRDKGLSYVELYKVIYLEKNEKNGNNQYEIKDKKIRAKVNKIKNIYKSIKNKAKKLDDKQENIINEILYDIIQYPSFLFKAKHFEYEQEVRIIKRFDINDENIKEDNRDVPELYVELDKPIICEEVILGAKCENKQAMATFLYNKGVKKVTQSKLKYK